MITAITGETLAAMANLGHAVNMCYEANARADSDPLLIKRSVFDAIVLSVKDIDRAGRELDLDATVAAAKQCAEMINRALLFEDGNLLLKRSDMERLSWSLQALRVNFSTQMASRLVFVIDTKNSRYLTSDEPAFGRDVDDTFPTASEEIAEASKCLALQRPTATVFHLIRAMELSVQRLAESLGITAGERVWGVLLANISKAIEVMPKGSIRDAYSASHSHLYHVKQAWRNDTMHPKTTYTEDQAQMVFEVVKSFMVHLTPLGSGLIDQSQKMMVAAMQMADMKVWAHRS